MTEAPEKGRWRTSLAGGGAWLPLLVFLGGCGGGGGAAGPSNPSTPVTPATPAPTPTPAGPIPAGTVIAVVSGETDQPVAGASVGIGGQTQRTDGSGQLVLGSAQDPRAPVEIRANGFLDRDTLLRSPGATRFTLWPRTSATGLSESYTSVLVYTNAGLTGGTPGTDPMQRLRPDLPPYLVPSQPILDDPAAVAAHQQAINAIAAATQGQVVYTLAAQRPTIAAAITTRVADSRDANCSSNTLGYASYVARDDEIAGAGIVFCRLDVARSMAVVTHEVGHTFGLQHSPDPQELMHGTLRANQNTAFSAREALTMRLMLQRRGGNRFPDDDRSLTVATERTVTIVCRY